MKSRSDVQRVWPALLLVFSMLFAGCGGMAPQGMSLQEQVDALMKEGQQLYSAKNYDQSIAKFSEALAKDPKYWQAHVWIARSFIAKGNWTDAIVNAKKAFDLAPNAQDVLAVLGEALFGGGLDALNRGQLADSVSRFSEYLKLDPGNVSAWLNVGKAYLGQAKFREALDAFMKGLANGGGSDRTELLRGLLNGGLQALQKGEFRNAIDLIREYLKFDSNNLSAYLNLAKAYWESGERGNALAAFRKVLELDPRNSEALRALLGG